MPLASAPLRDARIVVIGAGAVGAALSYRLAQAGAQVTTIERRYPGAGTSGNSFAWLNGFSKTPLHYHRLNVRSIRDHVDLADELGGDWVRVNGALHWEEEANETRLANLRQTVHRLREWGQLLERATPEQVMRELEPDVWVDPDRVSEVWVAPCEGWLNGVSMAHGVARGARLRYGAAYVRAHVVALRGPAGTVDTVVLDDGRELPADVVVNAAGPDAGRVAELAGGRLPLDRQIGVLLVSAPAPVGLKRVTFAGDLHFRPDGGARLTIQPEGIDSFAIEGESFPLDAEIVRTSIQRARAILPGLAEVRVEALRIGIRPMPRDGYPIVGFDPSVSGLYHTVTHSGITLSARLALLVTEELAGGDTAALEPYRPSRFERSSTPPP